MNKGEVVRARIEPDLKAEAEAALRLAGLEMSDAIRLFLRQVVRHRGLPFAVQAAPIARPRLMPDRGSLMIAAADARKAQVEFPPADFNR